MSQLRPVPAPLDLAALVRELDGVRAAPAQLAGRSTELFMLAGHVLGLAHAVRAAEVGSAPMPVSSPAAELPDLLTAQEAAELMRRSVKAVYAMANRGRLPRVEQPDSVVRFRKSDVLAFAGAPSPRRGRR